MPYVTDPRTERRTWVDPEPAPKKRAAKKSSSRKRKARKTAGAKTTKAEQ